MNATTVSSAAQAVAAALEWWYISRNVSRPDRSRIWTSPNSKEDDELPTAAEVFAVLELDLDQLKTIFSYRPKEPSSRPYAGLGGCSIDDQQKWQAIARLTGKIIHMVYESDAMQFYTWEEIAVYYPDCRVEKIK